MQISDYWLLMISNINVVQMIMANWIYYGADIWLLTIHSLKYLFLCSSSIVCIFVQESVYRISMRVQWMSKTVMRDLNDVMMFGIVPCMVVMNWAVVSLFTILFCGEYVIDCNLVYVFELSFSCHLLKWCMQWFFQQLLSCHYFLYSIVLSIILSIK